MPQEIRADNVIVRSSNAALIHTIAGAAALSVGAGSSAGVSISVGLSLAFNKVDTDVEASIVGATVTTTGGGVSVSAHTPGGAWFLSTVTAAALDDIAESDETPVDWQGDAVIRQAIVDMFALNDIDLATDDWSSTAAAYTTADGLQTINRGDLIRDLATGNAYRFVGTNPSVVDLSTETFSGVDWVLELPITVSTLVEGQSWTIVDGAGVVYDVRNTSTGIVVSRATVSVVAAAAALAVGVGGTAGVAVAGAGAVAINSVTGSTNAHIDNSTIVDNSPIGSAGTVAIDSASQAAISAVVVAAAIAVGAGGTAGVGVALGVSIARNFIGADLEGNADPLEVRAFSYETSIDAKGALTVEATAAQTISAVVIAAAVAIVAGGSAGVGFAGSGVWAENAIRAHLKAVIEGDGADGIRAASVRVRAIDSSNITSLAGAASMRQRSPAVPRSPCRSGCRWPATSSPTRSKRRSCWSTRRRRSPPPPST